MELAAGPLGTLGSKLAQLLHDEYVKQRGLKREVRSLCAELEMMDVALVEVSRVPPDKINDLDKTWAHKAQELSYDMEDAVDAFLVHVHRHDPAGANVFKKMVRKIKSMSIKKLNYRRQIYDKIKDMKDLSKELHELHARYRDFIRPSPAANTHDGVGPRTFNLNEHEGRELIGREEAREDLLRKLTHDQDSKSPLKVVSIVGCGGLGKTALAKQIHNKLKEQSFDCFAYVSVGRNPDITNILWEILEKLGKPFDHYMNRWQTNRFHEELRGFLEGKRYNIFVDDIWDKKTWKALKSALPDSNCGSKVIITTRNSEVVKKDDDVYNLQQLSHEKSKELFCKITTSKNNGDNECFLFGHGDNELVDKIVDKCDRVPLAIIAMASLLANRPLEDWQMVYDSIILGREEENTRTILLYSYYDLPSYLKPCLLYLSLYPEDCLIERSTMIWRWIAEGFVQLQMGYSSLLEVGERYFDELLNRSMIQPAEMDQSMIHPADIGTSSHIGLQDDLVRKKERRGIIDGCRVHDIVLDLIRDLSAEENFVTILGKKQFLSSESVKRMKEVGLYGLKRKVRRISIQSPNGKRIPQDTTSIEMPEAVRSLQSNDCMIDIPLLFNFKACRVLSIMGRRSSIGDLTHLGKLLNLRYLEIDGGGYRELPQEIGNLKSLQALIMGHKSWITELQPGVYELTQLTCLHALGYHPIQGSGDRMGNLVCLEELKLYVFDNLHSYVVELGKLTRLRVLEITGYINVKPTVYKALMQSLNKLEQIRELKLRVMMYRKDMTAWESWKPPRQLWSLDTDMGLSPQLMDPSSFRRLRYLSLGLEGMEADNIGNLALLPELLSLSLKVYKNHQGFLIGADGFKKLRFCEANTKFKFLEGAMLRLESLYFEVHQIAKKTRSDLSTDTSLRGSMAICSHCKGKQACLLQPCSKESSLGEQLHSRWTSPSRCECLCHQVAQNLALQEINLATLLSLKEVRIKVNCRDYFRGEVEEAEAVLRRQVEDHPNHPTLRMERIAEYLMLDELKPDKVVRVPVIVREFIEEFPGDELMNPICGGVKMQCYRWLEEITYDIDCEGSKLSDVEKIERNLSLQASFHHRGPQLVMNRINQDKMLGDDDHA